MNDYRVMQISYFHGEGTMTQTRSDATGVVSSLPSWLAASGRTA